MAPLFSDLCTGCTTFWRTAKTSECSRTKRNEQKSPCGARCRNLSSMRSSIAHLRYGLWSLAYGNRSHRPAPSAACFRTQTLVGCNDHDASRAWGHTVACQHQIEQSPHLRLQQHCDTCNLLSLSL